MSFQAYIFFKPTYHVNFILKGDFKNIKYFFMTKNYNMSTLSMIGKL